MHSSAGLCLLRVADSVSGQKQLAVGRLRWGQSPSWGPMSAEQLLLDEKEVLTLEKSARSPAHAPHGPSAVFSPLCIHEDRGRSELCLWLVECREVGKGCAFLCYTTRMLFVRWG